MATEVKMKVGDLVRHKSDGTFGTVLEVRRNHWQKVDGLAYVWWSNTNARVLHAVGQLEVVCK